MGSLFGVAGLPFSQNWNDIARAVNDMLNDKVLPTTESTSRELDKKLGTNGLAQFGLVSWLMGYDISGSASGPGVSLPGAGARAVTTLAELLFLSGKAFTQKGTDKQEWWELSQKMPPVFRSLGEMALRPGAGFGLGGSTTATQHYLETGRPRTLMDQVAMGAAGVRSTAENADRVTERLVKADEKNLTDKMGALARRMKSNPNDPKITQELVEMAQMYQIDPRAFIRAYITWNQTAQLDPDIKRAIRAKSLPQLGKYQRYNAEQSREPVRTP
jgi:hypothetical protein